MLKAMKNERVTPDVAKYGGSRRPANIRGDVQALHGWVERWNATNPTMPTLTLKVSSDAIVLLEVEDDGATCRVARFPLRDGHWRLQWMRGNGRWMDYEPGSRYLTLAIPMLLIDEDVDGCFWG